MAKKVYKFKFKEDARDNNKKNKRNLKKAVRDVIELDLKALFKELTLNN